MGHSFKRANTSGRRARALLASAVYLLAAPGGAIPLLNTPHQLGAGAAGECGYVPASDLGGCSAYVTYKLSTEVNITALLAIVDEFMTVECSYRGPGPGPCPFYCQRWYQCQKTFRSCFVDKSGVARSLKMCNDICEKGRRDPICRGYSQEYFDSECNGDDYSTAKEGCQPATEYPSDGGGSFIGSGLFFVLMICAIPLAVGALFVGWKRCAQRRTAASMHVPAEAVPDLSAAPSADGSVAQQTAYRPLVDYRADSGI